MPRKSGRPKSKNEKTKRKRKRQRPKSTRVVQEDKGSGKVALRGLGGIDEDFFLGQAFSESRIDDMW